MCVNTLLSFKLVPLSPTIKNHAATGIILPWGLFSPISPHLARSLASVLASRGCRACQCRWIIGIDQTTFHSALYKLNVFLHLLVKRWEKKTASHSLVCVVNCRKAQLPSTPSDLQIRIYVAKQNIWGAARFQGSILHPFSHIPRHCDWRAGRHSESQCRNVVFINSKRHCVRSTHRDEEYGEILTWSVEKS